jgi:putative membrane protein
MKTKIFSFILVSLMASSVFALPDITPSTNTQAMNEKQQNDGEAVAVIMTVDGNEIAAANLTAKKDVGNDVKQFAQFLYKQHSQNLKAIQSLSKKDKITPSESDKVNSLRDDGQKTMQTLTPLDNKAYEVAYIDAMVNGHKAVLTMIDDLMKNVSNSDLQKFLAQTRTHVAAHLQKALAIQTKLQSK